MELALKSQYDYYVAHEKELLQQHIGKHIVISDNFQVFSFANPKEAYRFGVQNFGAGHFMLHKCVPDSLNVVHQVNYAF